LGKQARIELSWQMRLISPALPHTIGCERKGERMVANDQEKIKIVREYFTRADQGRPDFLELFHEDAEIYFLKFGLGFGRNSFLEMVKGFESVLEYIQRDNDRLNFIPSADYLIVEGTSQGRMSGKSWAGGKTPGGRFCNVFKFRDGRISSLHIYLDPDYTGEDEAYYRWGKNRKW
jgi:ketosteroid isomerase-like protein